MTQQLLHQLHRFLVFKNQIFVCFQTNLTAIRISKPSHLPSRLFLHSQLLSNGSCCYESVKCSTQRLVLKMRIKLPRYHGGIGTCIYSNKKWSLVADTTCEGNQLSTEPYLNPIMSYSLLISKESISEGLLTLDRPPPHPTCSHTEGGLHKKHKFTLMSTDHKLRSLAVFSVLRKQSRLIIL